MEVLTVLLSLGLVLVSALFYVKVSAKRRRFVALINKLPGPRPWPIIGNAMDIMVPRDQLMKITDRHRREYWPLFRTWNGPSPEIHLMQASQVEIILSSMAHIEKSWMYSFLHPWLGQGLLTSTGAKWQAHRKMITPTFHFSILETFCEVFNEKCEILVDKLRREVDARGDAGFDVCPFVTRCALDIICQTAMGTDIHAQEVTHSEYVQAVYDISMLTMARAVRPWLHIDFLYKRSEIGRQYNHCLKVLHGFTNKVIQERKTENSKTTRQNRLEDIKEDVVFGKKKRLAFLDLLLLEASKGDVKLSDTEIREEVDTFMFEGHDTTTAGISWALFLIGSHPDVQEKVIDELDSIFKGSDRSITMRDLQDMKYLERVIKESLRLYPSVPFIMRNLNEDTEIGGYLLPAGVMINVHIMHLHRDPLVFPDPDAFNPDHFLPERVQGRHPYAYIPFSAGPRNCVGQKFAMLEEKTIIASVMRNFRLRALEKREDLVLISELILKPESGIKLVLTVR